MLTCSVTYTCRCGCVLGRVCVVLLGCLVYLVVWVMFDYICIFQFKGAVIDLLESMANGFKSATSSFSCIYKVSTGSENLNVSPC